MIIKIRIARIAVFLNRIGISDIMIADHRRQGNAVQGQMLEKQPILILISELCHMVAEMKEKAGLRDISRQSFEDRVPAVCSYILRLHLRLPDLDIGGHQKGQGVRSFGSLISIGRRPGIHISDLVGIGDTGAQPCDGGLMEIKTGNSGRSLTFCRDLRGFIGAGIGPADDSCFRAWGKPVHA